MLLKGTVDTACTSKRCTDSSQAAKATDGELLFDHGGETECAFDIYRKSEQSRVKNQCLINVLDQAMHEHSTCVRCFVPGLAELTHSVDSDWTTTS